LKVNGVPNSDYEITSEGLKLSCPCPSDVEVITSGRLPTEPTTMSGTFELASYTITSEKWVGYNYIFEGTSCEEWEGDFEGSGLSFFRAVWFNQPDGPLRVQLRSDFEGTVMGKEGTLVIQLVGQKSPSAEWSGTWKIISGTGELANLNEQGTWEGPGFGDPGPDIWYSGKMRFDS